MRKRTAYIALALIFPVSGCTGFALDDGARERTPEVAARPQCWVEQQEENWQTEDIEACRARFLAASSDLEPAFLAAVPTPAGLEIHFPFDSAESDDATVVVRDHADRAGEEADKLDLSLRRAVTVWRALLARGVPPALLLWAGALPTTAPRSQKGRLVRSIR